MFRNLAIALTMALATAAATAQTKAPSWILPDLLEGAKAEGSLNVYSSVNEQEGLPLWKEFETATGVKVNYTRANDAALTSKIQIEARSGQQSWDVLVTTSVTRLPPALRAQFDVPEAAAIPAQMRDPDRRWYGVYANYNTPAYNTNLVKKEDAPKSFAELLEPKWKSKIVKAHPSYSGTIMTATYQMQRDLGWGFFEKLHAIGHAAGVAFLAAHFDEIGREGTLDMRAELA